MFVLSNDTQFKYIHWKVHLFKPSSPLAYITFFTRQVCIITLRLSAATNNDNNNDHDENKDDDEKTMKEELNLWRKVHICTRVSNVGKFAPDTFLS